MRSDSWLYSDKGVSNKDYPRVEAGSNTSTVTLRVVGGDEKGSLKCEAVKYGLKSQGTRTREGLRWQGPAEYTKDRSDLSSKRALHKNKTVTVTHVDGCFAPRQTGRLTVGRNIRLRLGHKDYDRRGSVGKNLWSCVSRGLAPKRTDWR
jgi:hypothetical protein